MLILTHSFPPFYLVLFYESSYRRSSEERLATRIRAQLEQHFLELTNNSEKVNVSVFLDLNKDCIPPGSDFERKFMGALGHTYVFLPLLSEKALTPMKAMGRGGAKVPVDNMLRELERATKLVRQSRVLILPVLIGARPGKRFDMFHFGGHSFPNISSPTAHWDWRTWRRQSIRDTICKVFKNQVGLFIIQFTW